MKRSGVNVARKLRRAATDAEKRFWSAVRDRQINGAKFRRQVPVDGRQHTDNVDAVRTAALNAAGYQVMRFWNNDVLNNLSGVLETLSAALTRV